MRFHEELVTCRDLALRSCSQLLRAAFASMVLLVASPTRASSHSSLCIADLSTGFSWNGSEWQHARFNVKDDRFLIEETDPTTNYGYNYVVKQIGSKETANQCKRERLLNSAEMSSRIVCGGQHIGFLMDTKTLRFQQIYGGSFLNGDGTNTPSLTIGKCSELK